MDVDRTRREYLSMRQQLEQLDAHTADTGVELCGKLDTLDKLAASLADGSEDDRLVATACRFASSFLRATLLAKSVADFQEQAVAEGHAAIRRHNRLAGPQNLN